ncbi:hypothetical protein ROZALSC1DRAFT_23312 [Rozella allomycis CSF55]|uniref:Uncharacterized protein n=1 Tax=Rozella allomycis (strain CSF55) TaxID=988480 RepID=A0A4P9YGM7_ROZAC|nr:hypothetical protein ROZALSC1DRAFT_23312 [Rozella allomycis CSF55]
MQNVDIIQLINNADSLNSSRDTQFTLDKVEDLINKFSQLFTCENQTAQLSSIKSSYINLFNASNSNAKLSEIVKEIGYSLSSVMNSLKDKRKLSKLVSEISQNLVELKTSIIESESNPTRINNQNENELIDELSNAILDLETLLVFAKANQLQVLNTNFDSSHLIEEIQIKSEIIFENLNSNLSEDSLTLQ